MGERPSIYFHVEFGVSWPAKNRVKGHHQLTYQSKSLRQRGGQFPRRLPPTNTNFLVQNEQLPQNAHPYYPRQESHYPYDVPAIATDARFLRPTHQHDHLRNFTHPTPYGSQYYQPYVPRAATQFTEGAPTGAIVEEVVEEGAGRGTGSGGADDELLRESSRSQSSRSSQGRGRSAPPAFLDSPWDADPEPLGATALPLSKSRISHPQQESGAFRLGTDDMPWSSTPFFPTTAHGNSATLYPRKSQDSDVIPPLKIKPVKKITDKERGRAKEMASLASALMTVDNGFEDQWWYQGPRSTNVAGRVVTPIRRERLEGDEEGGALGWAVASSSIRQPDEEEDMDAGFLSSPSLHPFVTTNEGAVRSPLSSHSDSFADMVSPITSVNSRSPQSSVHIRGGLRRSLTSGSDEYFVYR